MVREMETSCSPRCSRTVLQGQQRAEAVIQRAKELPQTPFIRYKSIKKQLKKRLRFHVFCLCPTVFLDVKNMIVFAIQRQNKNNDFTSGETVKNKWMEPKCLVWIKNIIKINQRHQNTHVVVRQRNV